MCLPSKQSDRGETASRSILGLGVVMLLACLAGPALIGVVGGLGAGVLVGAAGVVAALVLCSVVPAGYALLDRRRPRRPTRSA
jgi:hypothetical protein